MRGMIFDVNIKIYFGLQIKKTLTEMQLEIVNTGSFLIFEKVRIDSCTRSLSTSCLTDLYSKHLRPKILVHSIDSVKSNIN